MKNSEVYEILDIFADEMKNEIFHHISDDTLQDILLDSVDQAKNLAISTYGSKLK